LAQVRERQDSAGPAQRKPAKESPAAAWFPDGQAYAATWENGQLAQFERDKVRQRRRL
jgi:hypothetical protein